MGGATSGLLLNSAPGATGYFLVSGGAANVTPSWSNVLPPGATISFSQITSGVNTQPATMTLGNGSSLTTSGTGFISGAITGATITASTMNSTPIGVSSAAAGNFTSIGVTTAGTGKFTTLESTGSSTIGDGVLATVNSFGTAGNAAAAANTIGSTVGGSTNVFNGNNTINGTTQFNNNITQPAGNATFASSGGSSFTAGNSGGVTTINGSSINVTGTNVSVTGTSIALVGAVNQLAGAVTIGGATQINNTFNSTGNSQIGSSGATVNTIGGTNASTNTLTGASTATNQTTYDARALNVENNQTPTSPYTADNGTSALQVQGGISAASNQADGNGQAAATSQRYWADSYTTPTPGTAVNTETIYNSLVSTTSTIIISIQPGAGNTPGDVYISGIANGSFTITNSAQFNNGLVNSDIIHYEVINH